MYLHLGADTVIRTKDVIGIFDLDNATVMRASRDFLTRAEKEKKVVTVSYELPKSFVLCEENKEVVYISQLAVSTLVKRSKTKLSESVYKNSVRDGR